VATEFIDLCLKLQEFNFFDDHLSNAAGTFLEVKQEKQTMKTSQGEVRLAFPCPV
jgi:hypothetical protein